MKCSECGSVNTTWMDNGKKTVNICWDCDHTQQIYPHPIIKFNEENFMKGYAAMMAFVNKSPDH